MARKITKTRAKDRAWKAFSLYIRTRDTIERNDVRIGSCVTCQKVYPLQQLQAGHFIPGRRNSVLFNEDIVHAQCYGCNVGLYGNPRAYDKFMRSKYSPEEIEKFDRLPNKSIKYSVLDYLDIEAEYKEKTKRLLNG